MIVVGRCLDAVGGSRTRSMVGAPLTHDAVGSMCRPQPRTCGTAAGARGVRGALSGPPASGNLTLDSRQRAGQPAARRRRITVPIRLRYHSAVPPRRCTSMPRVPAAPSRRPAGRCAALAVLAAAADGRGGLLLGATARSRRSTRSSPAGAAATSTRSASSAPTVRRSRRSRCVDADPRPLRRPGQARRRPSAAQGKPQSHRRDRHHRDHRELDAAGRRPLERTRARCG